MLHWMAYHQTAQGHFYKFNLPSRLLGHVNLSYSQSASQRRVCGLVHSHALQVGTVSLANIWACSHLLAPGFMVILAHLSRAEVMHCLVIGHHAISCQ